MARDVSRHSDSVASSTGSKHGTVSPDSTLSTDFNPERDEALVSTIQLDTQSSQKLPHIRDTAKKCGRWAPRPQTTYVVDTSAIGRAFPDFSGGVSSDDNISVEIGRGNWSRPRTTTIYEDTEEPLHSPRHPVFHEEETENISLPKATSPYISNASRAANGQRRPLQARVADESEITMDATRSSIRSNRSNRPTQSTLASGKLSPLPISGAVLNMKHG